MQIDIIRFTYFAMASCMIALLRRPLVWHHGRHANIVSLLKLSRIIAGLISSGVSMAKISYIIHFLCLILIDDEFPAANASSHDPARYENCTSNLKNYETSDNSVWNT